MLFSIFINKYLKLLGAIPPMNKFMGFLALNCDIVKLSINYNGYASYGTNVNDIGILISANDLYYEFKDVGIYSCYTGIKNSSNSEIWFFDAAVDTCTEGIKIATTSSGSTLGMSEVEFTNVTSGITLLSGYNSNITIEQTVFDNNTIAINYYSSPLFTYSSFYIKNNIFNTTDINKTLKGFIWSSATDANVYVLGNTGYPDKSPSAHVEISTNTTATTITTAGTYYKIRFNESSVVYNSLTKFSRAASSPDFYYLPTYTKNLRIRAFGNVQDANANRTVGLAICKNGNNTVRYGLMQVRVTTRDVPFAFALEANLDNFAYNEYFSLFVTESNNGASVTIT